MPSAKDDKRRLVRFCGSTFVKSLHIKRMPDFVSSLANFCHLLLSFVRYFDVFPYKFMVTKFPYRVYSWPISRKKRLFETTTKSPPCPRHIGPMTSSYKYTTLCFCICPLNHYRRWKTVPAANVEKSTNLGEVCEKCHVMSPLLHTN